MIRLYLALGVLALVVGLAGWALLERAGRKLEAEKVAGLETEVWALKTTLEAEKTKAAKAARIAAASANQAKNLTVEVRRLREVHKDVTSAPPDEPDPALPQCSPTCRDLSRGERDRLLRITIGQPATAKPGDKPAPAPGGGGTPLPRSGH